MTHTPEHIRDGDLWLIGGGGHAVVVAEAAVLAGIQVTGYFDDRDDAGIPGCPRLGDISQAVIRNSSTAVILAIGDLAIRGSWIRRIRGPFTTVVHPTSTVSASAKVASGSFLGAGAVVNSCATLDAHTIVNTRAVIEHNCHLSENSHVGPGAILGGGVTVGRNTLIGINASIRPNIVIGDGCTIGAGATVVRDVPDGQIVVGIPARPLVRATSFRRTA